MVEAEGGRIQTGGDKGSAGEGERSASVFK